MHPSAFENASRFYRTYCEALTEPWEALEIGSLDVNGSLRNIFTKAKNYIGIDFVKGKSVDLLITDPYNLPLEDNAVDIVICSSVFEHSEFFWLLFLDALRILKPGGLFYLNAPSNGTFHRYPVDCWRFYPDSGVALSNWGRHNGYEVELLESYISEQKKECWNDFVAVFHKGKNGNVRFPSRIIHSFSEFTNGIIDGTTPFINESFKTQDQKLIQEAVSTQTKNRTNTIIATQTDSILRSCLDSPKVIRSGKNIVKGWALATSPNKTINLLLKEDGVIRALPLNTNRPDVIRKILNEEPDNHPLLSCGFLYESSSIFSIEIGLECTGNVTWFN